MHRHKWKTVGIHYDPPFDFELERGARARGQAADELMALLRKAAEGFSTVSQECERCGKAATRQFYGKYTDERTA